MNIEESTKILKEFRKYNKFYKEENRDLTITITLEAKESIDKAIERLLTAYEKEKNKDMSCDLTEMRADHIDESTMLKQIKLKLQEKNIPIETLLAEFERLEDLEDDRIILKSELEKEKEKNKKTRWKPIKDYDRKKYDWVLVKYFDGDYKCVPEVAEKRSDGKWYTSERQIPFEVKYFFDMQEILEEE